MNSPLRIGIIGCGVIGPTHIESYQRLDNVDVTWVCDLQEEKAKQCAEKYNIGQVTANFAELLAADVDCVSVCTDHASHAPISVAALNAGKHVLCEKALAASTEGLDAMISAHQEHPELVFSGVFQHRFDPPYQALKRLVEEDAFGQILTAGVQVRCQRTNEYYQADAWRGTWGQEGGGVLINQAIHFIDILVWVMGGVSALCGRFQNLTHGDTIETEDTAVAAVHFNNGSLGTIEATCSSHMRWENTISIHGTEGSIDIRGGKPMKAASADPERKTQLQAAFDQCREDREIAASATHYGCGHPGQIADFIQAVANKSSPLVPAVSARHAVDVVLAIYESWRQRAWVKVGGTGVRTEALPKA